MDVVNDKALVSIKPNSDIASLYRKEGESDRLKCKYILTWHFKEKHSKTQIPLLRVAIHN